MFGTWWISTFEERVFAGGDGYMKYARGDSSVWSFGWKGFSNAGNTFAPASPAQQLATLTQGTSVWTLTFQNGEQRVFDYTTGHLLSITDRNGNTTQLSYDAQNRLTTVTDAAARHLYFTYVNGSSSLVSTVTSDVGLSLSYAYDGSGNLVTVTKPDQTTVTYVYSQIGNPNYWNPYWYITAVKDSAGKILEAHTYDIYGSGTSSSRANGVEALTVNYHP